MSLHPFSVEEMSDFLKGGIRKWETKNYKLAQKGEKSVIIGLQFEVQIEVCK